MGLITLPDSNFEDGVLPLKPNVWTTGKTGGTSSDGLSVSDIKKIIAETVTEKNDNLMVDGKVAGTDNYVRSGELNEDGNLKLELGEGKETDIDLSDLQTKPLTSDDIKKAAQG